MRCRLTGVLVAALALTMIGTTAATAKPRAAELAEPSDWIGTTMIESAERYGT